MSHQTSSTDTQDITVELTIRVKVRKAAGAEVNEFIENLDYSVVSGTEGVSVIETEMVEAEFAGA